MDAAHLQYPSYVPRSVKFAWFYNKHYPTKHILYHTLKCLHSDQEIGIQTSSDKSWSRGPTMLCSHILHMSCLSINI